MRSLLADSMQTLLDTAQTPLPENWNQTLDLPQVCKLNRNQELSLFIFGHIAVLSLTGVRGSHSASSGAGLWSGISCPSVCSYSCHLVSHSTQFSLLGHEERCSATLQ